MLLWNVCMVRAKQADLKTDPVLNENQRRVVDDIPLRYSQDKQMRPHRLYALAVAVASASARAIPLESNAIFLS